MEPETTSVESFVEFKNSFSYGSRTDLNFKFLAGLSEKDGAGFFQELLWKLGDTLNDGQVERLIEHVAERQCQSYSGTSKWTYDDGPFTSLQKPLAESKLALLTSSGHFVDGDDPEPFGVKQMAQKEATARIGDFLKVEPTLSSIPASTHNDDLRVRHGGYDIRGAQADPNVVFPLERLREFEREGTIGELATEAFSFVGACAQTRLLKHTGPQWASKLQEQQIDAILLVPV